MNYYAYDKDNKVLGGAGTEQELIDMLKGWNIEYDHISTNEPMPSLVDIKLQAQGTIQGKLSATDYKCLKYIDGALSEEEYSDTKNERARLRELYNLIEDATTIEDIEEILSEV